MKAQEPSKSTGDHRSPAQFADDAGCDVVKDNEAKVFLFRKRKDSPTAKY